MDDDGGDGAAHGHLLLLPVTEAERRSRVADWVFRGLERREKVIYAELEPGSSLRWLSRALGESGIDPGADDRLLVQPLARGAPGERAELVERALGEGYPGVRVSAELSWTRLAAETIAAYEREVDELSRSHPVSVLCQYDRRSGSGAQLAEAARLHCGGIREALLQTRCTAGGIAVVGELDMSNAQLLGAALRAVAGSVTAALEVDLAGLRFLDAAGCRVLREVAQELVTRAVRLVLLAPQPPVARVLALLGLDRLPHVEIVDSRGSR